MKTCEHCGESYAKRPKEAYWQFDERKFCSRACANDRHGIWGGKTPQQRYAMYRRQTPKSKGMGR